MEPGYSLTILVFAVGALHLVWRAGAFMNKYFAAGRDLQAGAVKRAKRDDWYMFFHRSDLTGELTEKTTAPPSSYQNVRDNGRGQKRQVSRPAATLR